MKKLWRKVRKGSPARSGEASPKSGSTRGSVASLNIGYDVREKDLGKLHKAAWNGDLNKVKQLAKKDPSPLDKENRTPLHLACIQGHDQIVQELLEWKAKTNIGDNQSRTPLMRAVEFQQEGCVNLLTTYRADVETGDGQGNTPLHMAVMGGGLGIVTLLIKAGASLNTRNKEGFSPLHLAVRNKMEDVCRLLLKERADIDIEDTNLRTPLMYACQDGSVSLVRLLLGYNANTLHKDSKGWSADDYAVIPGHHACSQLITDHNHRVSRSTPQSTPRSSLPPSVVNTPRDKDSIGLPAQDAEDDDSENETISKASGGPDSWADSPEISIMDDKKGKPAAAKVDVTKFAHAIHISESDTDGESFRGPTPRKTPKDEEADDDDDQMGMPTTQGAAVAEGKRAAAAAVASARQTSWQSQTSGEDNSWGDSPVAQRKNSTQRVSFKRDEELSEVHDITVTESEAESDVHDPGAKPQVKTSTPAKPSVPSTESGYVPTGAAGSAGVSPSHEKMRGDTQKTALMDELGISDVDDISEMSDSAPALPASPPPKATNPSPGVDEWDSSAVSDIMTTPRPGILKKWGNSSLQSSGEGKQQPTSPQQKPAAQTKTLIKAPAVDSGDESSAWDTTEAEHIGARSKPGPSASATAAPGPPQHKDSVSEWDSDLEDLVNPVTPAVAATPTPPPPNATITKENNANDEDADDDDWDSTTDAITPRQNAGLQYKEVNVGGPSSISEPLVPVQTAPVAQPVPESAVTASAVAAQAQGQGGGGMMAADDEDTESAWDSDGDALPSESADPPAYDDPPPPYLATPLIPTAITSPRTSQLQGAATSGQPAAQEGKVHAGVGVKAQASPAFDSDEDSETVSSWELERKRQRSKPQTSVDLNFGSRTESPNRQREIEEDAMRQEQNELQERLREQKLREEEERRKEKEEQRKREEEEEQRLRAEEVKRAREEAERKEREEAERQEQQRREWEREEMRREEERQREWEREEAEKKERQRREAEEIMEREELERNEQSMNPVHMMPEQNGIMSAQQELNRIDEQFQRERAERERKEEEEKRRKRDEEEEAARRQKEEEEERKGPPPSLAPRPYGNKTVSALQSSSSTGIYVNFGNSTADQIKQRLQVPPPSGNMTVSPPNTGLTSTGPFSPANDGFDDDDSFISDLPGDDRPRLPQSYYPGLLGSNPGMYRPHDPLDDDALSYTSTEFEDPVQSSAAYGRDRDVLSNISINDPSSLLKVQEYVRDTRRQLEQERNQRAVLDNKLKLSSKEKAELSKKLDSLTQHKSELEQSKLDLEAKIRSLEYGMTEEEEKRKNAEILLSKTKDQLARREEQYASELEAKQRAELTMRNLQIEMRSSANTIKELEEEREELQRQVTHANNARLLQEQINDDQQKFIHQQTTQQAQHTPRDSKDFDESPELSGDMDKLRAELYALKMEMDRQRSRFKDEVTLMGAENEELLSKNEELKNDIRLNEEALAHATMQYNIQVASLRTEISTASASTDRERATREKLEAEIESLKTRLFASNQEMDKINRVRNELERDHRREKETWVREMERKEEEVNMLKDNAQHLNQRLHATDSKFNSMENELHVSNTSLMERTSQLQQIRQDLERQKTAHEQLDQNNKLEKDHNAKLQAKVESIQEKLSHQQHENLSLKQQMDSLKLSGGGLPGSEANEKLNAILTNLRADSERARASLEERNTSLVEQVARLKEEVRSGETRRATLEQELRRLHEEHSDMVKKLSHAEASLQMTMRSKDQLEQERAQLRVEMEKLQQRYQSTHDKSVEAQARVSELVDRLEKAEHSSLFSTQQLANTSANMQAVTKSKSELDESMQQLQIDNARLEAELKYEKQRADMLSQDLQDSQKVRSSLEALCANLKSSSAHLEEKLGIADLERNKQVSESRLGEEKSRVNLVNEEKRSLEARLGEEMEKNQQLQKDVNTLKLHLKSAKNKMKAQIGEAGGGDLRSELEARYRLELNRKLDDVNRFLDTQSLLRDRLDTSRTEAETNLLFDKRKLEEENNNLRVKYEQAVAQRETKEMEARRFRELYESEMKWRMRISDQLTLATDKGFNLKSKLNSERMHRNRLTGSIGNLNSSIVSNNSFEAVRVNGIHDDELSSKIKAELDRSIAKHLEAAPHNHNKPVLRPGKEAARFTSSFTQASHDYIDLLKRKYCV